MLVAVGVLFSMGAIALLNDDLRSSIQWFLLCFAFAILRDLMRLLPEEKK